MLTGIGKQLRPATAGTLKTEITGGFFGNGTRGRKRSGCRQNYTAAAKGLDCSHDLTGRGTGLAFAGSHINMNGPDIIMDRGFFAPVYQYPGKHQGIKSSGNSYKQPVFIGEHTVIQHCPSDTPIFSRI
jgi:hypothetical protein